MCMIRCFYECSDGKLGWSEMILSYEDDIKGAIKHWSTGGRMVTTEYFEV